LTATFISEAKEIVGVTPPSNFRSLITYQKVRDLVFVLLPLLVAAPFGIHISILSLLVSPVSLGLLSFPPPSGLSSPDTYAGFGTLGGGISDGAFLNVNGTADDFSFLNGSGLRTVCPLPFNT
jgi:hypothetical protein